MNKNGFFHCASCGHLQHTTTFGECEECGAETLKPLRKAEYELLQAAGRQPADLSPAVIALEKEARSLVTRWSSLGREIEKRLSEPERWLMPQAVDELKAERAATERDFASVRRAIALLGGEAPVFIHHVEFGADQQISLHLTEEEAIQDVKDTWTRNEFDPEADGSLIFKTTLKGGFAIPCWGLTEDGSLMNGSGDELVGFGI